jgi:hypothetical protein
MINYTILVAPPSPGDPPPAPVTGQVAAGSGESITMPDGAMAIGFTDFTGNAYISAPGATLPTSDALEMVGLDSGAPPPIPPSSAASGQVLFADVATFGAAWVMETSDVGPMMGTLPPWNAAAEPLDVDVTWLGFTGITADVYTLAPGISYPGYLAALTLFNATTPIAAVHAAFMKRMS